MLMAVRLLLAENSSLTIDASRLYSRGRGRTKILYFPGTGDCRKNRPLTGLRRHNEKPNATIKQSIFSLPIHFLRRTAARLLDSKYSVKLTYVRVCTSTFLPLRGRWRQKTARPRFRCSPARPGRDAPPTRIRTAIGAE